MADRVPKKPKATPQPQNARARQSAIRKRKALMAREARRAGSFAMVQPQRVRVSSAALHHVGSVKPARPVDKPWQSRAFELVDGVGELGYLLNTKANMVADCSLLPQYQDDAGDWILAAPQTDDAALQGGFAAANRVLNSFVGPQGGQRELKRRAALHLSTAGETHLLGTVPEEEGDVGIVWEFLSTDELREDGHSFSRVRDGSSNETLPAEHYLARCWRSHARFSDLADSELRRVIPIAEEVLILTQLVDAIAKSRLAAGILYIPDEVSFASEDDESDDVNDDAEQEGVDEFTKRLMEHLSAPVEDRTSAAALVPLIMRGPAEFADKVVMIDLARQLDTWAQDLRQEALSRLATGLDSPPEVMTGKGGLAGLGGGNVAASIDIEFVLKHIIPLGELLADFLTFAYLRPCLETFEGMDPVAAMRYRIAFDPSPIMSSGDEGGSAQRLYQFDPSLLSAETVRKANRFDDSDAPDDEEALERRKWLLVSTQPAVFARALLPTMRGFETIDPDKLGAMNNTAGGKQAEQPPEVAPGDTTDTSGTIGVLASAGWEATLPAYAALRLSLAVASDAVIERAVDRAATRVCAKANKLDVETRAAVRAASKHRVLQLVTPEQLGELGLDAAALLEGAWEPLTERARTWTKVHLVERGVDARDADSYAAKVAGRLTVGLQGWTTERLHDGFATRHQGFRMPISIVDAALAVLEDVPQTQLV